MEEHPRVREFLTLIEKAITEGKSVGVAAEEVGRQYPDLAADYVLLRRREVVRHGPIPVDKGGPGSGNFGHAGIPGQVGGSAPGGSWSQAAFLDNPKSFVDIPATDEEVKEVARVAWKQDADATEKQVSYARDLLSRVQDKAKQIEPKDQFDTFIKAGVATMRLPAKTTKWEASSLITLLRDTAPHGLWTNLERAVSLRRSGRPLHSQMPELALLSLGKSAKVAALRALKAAGD